MILCTKGQMKELGAIAEHLPREMSCTPFDVLYNTLVPLGLAR